MKGRICITLILMACICAPLNAWHDNGHFETALIAQMQLLQINPEAFNWANNLLLPLVDECGEKLYPFVESATWADKIKEQGWFTMSDAHFTQRRFFDGVAEKPYDAFPNMNIVFAINDAINTLSTTRKDVYGSSYSLLGKSMALRYLIHFVGDIHQPLHNGSRVTDKNPDGDMGGNKFVIKYYNDNFKDKLHFIWDQMFQDESEGIRGNITVSDFEKMKTKCRALMAEYPFEGQFKTQILTRPKAQDWTDESHQIIKDFVYKSIKEGERPSDEYMAAAKSMCRRQVALGGYRLAITIDQIYKTYLNNRAKDTAQGKNF